MQGGDRGAGDKSCGDGEWDKEREPRLRLAGQPTPGTKVTKALCLLATALNLINKSKYITSVARSAN